MILNSVKWVNFKINYLPNSDFIIIICYLNYM